MNDTKTKNKPLNLDLPASSQHSDNQILKTLNQATYKYLRNKDINSLNEHISNILQSVFPPIPTAQTQYKKLAYKHLNTAFLESNGFRSSLRNVGFSLKKLNGIDAKAFDDFIDALTPQPTGTDEELLAKKSLDVTTPPPLKNTKQHPTEREIMDEKATIGIEFADATDPVAIGTAILSARNFAELSQTQLIDKTGISLRTLSRLESGKANNLPTLKTLDEIAKATGTELSISFKPK